MTDRAADKVKEIATSESLSEQGLRLRVVGGGCAGFTYDLYFEDQTTDMDETFESKGVTPLAESAATLRTGGDANRADRARSAARPPARGATAAATCAPRPR